MWLKFIITQSSRTVWAAVGVTSMTLATASCGGGSSGTPASGGSSAPAASAQSVGTSITPFATVTPRASAAPVGLQPSSGANAQASVRADWTAFFDPATPIAQREALLQNGRKFIAYLQAQAQPGVARVTTEQVTAVTVIHTLAVVTYNILVSGVTSSALSNLSGQATFANGTWQVSDSDFCSLLRIENKGKPVPGC